MRLEHPTQTFNDNYKLQDTNSGVNLSSLEMRHVFYFYGRSRRQFERVFGMHNDM